LPPSCATRDQISTYKVIPPPALPGHPDCRSGGGRAPWRALAAFATPLLAPGAAAAPHLRGPAAPGAETRAFLLLHTRRGLWNELRERRAAIRRELDEPARASDLSN
jgi:hypothetical protein